MQKTILIVDDHEDSRQVLELLLAAEGHQVIGVGRGEEALAELSRGVPDLIILDMSMPGVSGADLLASLRSDPRTAVVPVVVFSAHAETKFRDQAAQAGATAYWVKGDVDFTAIGAEVRGLLGS